MINSSFFPQTGFGISPTSFPSVPSPGFSPQFAPVGIGSGQNLTALANMMQAYQAIFQAFAAFAGAIGSQVAGGGQFPSRGQFPSGGQVPFFPSPNISPGSINPGGLSFPLHPGPGWGPGNNPSTPHFPSFPTGGLGNGNGYPGVGNGNGNAYPGVGNGNGNGYDPGAGNGAANGPGSGYNPGVGNGQGPAAPAPSAQTSRLSELSQTEQNRITAQATRLLSSGFGRIDKNNDGIVSADEINLFAEGRNLTPALKDAMASIAGAVPELMFGNIDSGESAWFGLTKKDLQATRARLQGGESLQDIQAETRDRVIRQRRIPTRGQSPAVAFRTYVEQQRQRALG